MESQTTTCALCGEQSLPHGRRVPSCECTPDGRIHLDDIESYVKCRNHKCGRKISKSCYRLIRKAAMEAFPEFTEDPVEFERILDDDLGIWRAIFDDVVESSEHHAKHSAVFSPSANGKAAIASFSASCARTTRSGRDRACCTRCSKAPTPTSTRLFRSGSRRFCRAPMAGGRW